MFCNLFCTCVLDFVRGNFCKRLETIKRQMRMGKAINFATVVIPTKRPLNWPPIQTAPARKKKYMHVQVQPEKRPQTPPPNLDLLNSQESLGSMWSPRSFEDEPREITFSQVTLPSSPVVCAKSCVAALSKDDEVLKTLSDLRNTIVQARQSATQQLAIILDETMRWRVSVISREFKRALEQIRRIECGESITTMNYITT